MNLPISGKTLRIGIAFLIVYVVWGSTYLAIRVGVESIPPFLMGGMRFIIAGSIMGMGALVHRGSLTLSRKDLMYAVITGLLLFVGGNGMVIYAEQTVASGLTALIIAVTPLCVAGLEKVIHASDRLKMKGIVGIVLGFIGVAVLLLPDLRSQSIGFAIGIGALLVATVSWASGSIIIRRHQFTISVFLLSSIQMFAGGILMLAVSGGQNLFTKEVFAQITMQSWMALTYLIMFGSCVAFTAYTYLLRNVPVSRVATYAYVNPVIAVFLGAFILGEPLTKWLFLGMIIIICSLTLIRR